MNERRRTTPLEPIEIDIDLASAHKTPFSFIDVDGCDSVSILCQTWQGDGDFNGGIISVQQANMRSQIPVDFETAVTITGVGVTNITLADYKRPRYIVLSCTTAASSATGVLARVQRNEFNFRLT